MRYSPERKKDDEPATRTANANRQGDPSAKTVAESVSLSFASAPAPASSERLARTPNTRGTS